MLIANRGYRRCRTTLFGQRLGSGARMGICGNLSVRPQKRENPLQERASDEAAEGIRTLDLLHGKQTL